MTGLLAAEDSGAARLVLSPRWVAVLWAVFFALILYHVVGFFPVAAVEGDDAGIACGAELIAAGSPDARSVAYRYHAQPGVYSTVVGLRRIAGLPSLAGFQLISSVGSLIFVVVGAALLGGLLACPVPACGIALVLFQETFAGGSYANSTTPAATAALVGLYLLWCGGGPLQFVAAGLALGVAGWMRADAVLITPVALALVVQGSWRERLQRLAIAGVVALATVLLLFAASGSGLRDLVQDSWAIVGAGGWSHGIARIQEKQTVRAHLAYFSLPFAFAGAYGLLLMLRRRRWNLLFAFVLGFLPSWLVYVKNLSTPKWLYVCIPFVVLPALYGLLNGGKRRKAVTTLIVILFVGQYLVGSRLAFRAKPWAEQVRPDGLVLWSQNFRAGPITQAAVALGPGIAIPTDDGLRLGTGILFAPLAWHAQKVALAESAARLGAYLRGYEGERLDLYTGIWYARTVLNYILASSGFELARFEPLPNAARYTWRLGRLTVVHTSVDSYTFDWSERRRGLDLVDSPSVVYVAGSGRERNLLIANLKPRRTIVDSVGITCLAAFEVDLSGDRHP